MIRQIRRSTGFTLIELMTTVVVVTVVLAVGIPSISNMRNRSQLASVTNKLTGAVNFARSEAVVQGDFVGVVASGTWSDGWNVFNGTFTPSNTFTPVGPPIRVFSQPVAGVTVVPTSADVKVIFRPLGNANVADCFDISAPGGSVRSVVLPPSGRSQVCRVDCATVIATPANCN